MKAIAKSWRLVLAAVVVVWLLADRAARNAALLGAAAIVTATVMWITYAIVKAKHPRDEEGDVK